MKKLILSLLTALVALPQISLAGNFPTVDFELTNGTLKDPNPAEDPAASDLFFSQTAYIANLKISQGKVTASQTVPVGFKLYEQKFDGNGTLTVDGDYDAETGLITGTFTYSENEHYVMTWTTPDGIVLNGDSVNTGSGKVKGNVVGDRAVLIYSVQMNSSGRKQLGNGSYEPVGGTYTRYHRVAYDVELNKGDKGDEEVFDLPGADANKDSGARFSTLTGEIEWKMPSEASSEWRLCKMGMPIPVGAMIKTSDYSHAVLSFADQSTFVLKPETTMVITTPPGKETKLQLIGGSIWANVRKMAIDGTMDIEMNQAVAGIKGTIFECIEKDGVSTLKVYRGDVAFTPKATGTTEHVYQGQTAWADATQTPAKDAFDSETEGQAWKQLVISLEPEAERAVQGPPLAGVSSTNASSPNRKSAQQMIAGALVVLGIIGVAIKLRKK